MVTFPTQIETEMKFCIEKETKSIYLSRFSDKVVFPKERPLGLCIFLIKTLNINTFYAKLERHFCIIFNKKTDGKNAIVKISKYLSSIFNSNMES